MRTVCREYLKKAEEHLDRACRTKEEVLASALINPLAQADVAELEGFIKHAKRQIDQIQRRVLEEEVIPHEEKVFSIFEPHTEWISKGKAGVPVELGLKVCIMEDQHRFILHHRVMEKETDDQVAIGMVEKSQAHYPQLRVVSMDKGFHSPANRQALEKRLDLVVMPKKGRLSPAERARENAPEFVETRHQHSAVESAINGLEHFGLNLCPDHGLTGFKRYVALAVLARNIHRLGVLVRERSLCKTPSPPERERRAA